MFSIDLSKCTLYEWQALHSEICYCAVKRDMIKGKWKYYIQITLKGHVPDKFDKQTGELKKTTRKRECRIILYKHEPYGFYR